MKQADIRNLSLGEILYFCKMVEYNSVTKTAEYFHLTQSAISKKLNSLENQLEIQLFVRSGKKFKLTPAGKYFYEQWKTLPDKISSDIQMGYILQEGYQNSLIVGALDSVRLDAFLQPIIKSFTQKYPDIYIQLESGAVPDIRQQLISGEVDVAFSILYDFENKNYDEIEWKLLGESPHYVCMLPENPLASKEALQVEDLKHSHFISIAPHILPEYTEMLQQLCSFYGFRPNITKIVMSAISLSLNLTEADEIYICDKYFREFNNPNFCFRPLRDTKSGYVAAWHRNESKRTVMAFITELIENYSKVEY